MQNHGILILDNILMNNNPNYIVLQIINRALTFKDTGIKNHTQGCG
jgi:hypothetical protein